MSNFILFYFFAEEVAKVKADAEAKERERQANSRSRGRGNRRGGYVLACIP